MAPARRRPTDRPPREDLFRAAEPGSVALREDGEGDGRTLYGHFARFDEWTEIDSFFEGRFMERIARGAFAKTLAERRPKVLFDHGGDPSLGNKLLGTLEDVREEAEGAYYEARLFGGIPDLLMEGLRSGAYGASFRFSVTREDWIEEPRRSAHNPHGLPERTLTEVKLYELGPVSFPAYAGASAGVRSLTDHFRDRGAGAEPHPAEGRPAGRAPLAGPALARARPRRLRGLREPPMS